MITRSYNLRNRKNIKQPCKVVEDSITTNPECDKKTDTNASETVSEVLPEAIVENQIPPATIDNGYEFNNYIYVSPHSLDKDLCNEIIKLFETSTNQHPGVISSGLNEKFKKTRDLHMNIEQDNFRTIDNILVQKLNRHIYNYMKATNEHYRVLTFGEVEDSGFNIQKYTKNVGYYHWHNDEHIKVQERKHRLLTYIWYLNDVHVGGETEFAGNYKIKPEAGKFVFFPASWTCPHRGIMPIDNDKYIITGWIYNSYDFR